MPRRVLIALVCSALALPLTACDDEGTTAADDIVIITPTPVAPATSAPTDDTITLPAMTPGAIPGGDDPFCVAIITAVTDYNEALQAYTDELLAVTATAATTGDMGPINELGIVVSDMGRQATDRLDDALELTDDKAAREGLTGMIEYLDAYLGPVTLIMTGASDFNTFNTDLTNLTQSQLGLINRQTGHANAVGDYALTRCGADLEVLTAG